MSGGKDSEPTDPDPLTCTQGRWMWGGGPQKLPFRTKDLQDTTEGILSFAMVEKDTLKVYSTSYIQHN